jgi:hypothetical protein
MAIKQSDFPHNSAAYNSPPDGRDVYDASKPPAKGWNAKRGKVLPGVVPTSWSMVDANGRGTPDQLQARQQEASAVLDEALGSGE